MITWLTVACLLCFCCMCSSDAAEGSSQFVHSQIGQLWWWDFFKRRYCFSELPNCCYTASVLCACLLDAHLQNNQTAGDDILTSPDRLKSKHCCSPNHIVRWLQRIASKWRLRTLVSPFQNRTLIPPNRWKNANIYRQCKRAWQHRVPRADSVESLCLGLGNQDNKSIY